MFIFFFLILFLDIPVKKSRAQTSNKIRSC